MHYIFLESDGPLQASPSSPSGYKTPANGQPGHFEEWRAHLGVLKGQYCELRFMLALRGLALAILICNKCNTTSSPFLLIVCHAQCYC